MSRVPELRMLTGARGIAAWGVVLFHIRLSVAGLPELVRAVLGKGYLAVDFFFLLSGFVMALSWGPRLHAERWRAVLPFLRKRFARVWPLHAVMLGYAAVLAAVLALAGHADPAFPFAALPRHLLLVQAWGWSDPLAWNDPAWSISAEFAAYLLFPLSAMLVDWRRVPSWLLLAVAGAVLMALYLAMATMPTLGSDIARFGVVRCLAEFGAGTLLCALWLRRPMRIAGPAIVAAFALAIWAMGAPETLAAPVALAAALLVLAAVPAPRWRAVHYLGTISYATYLSHFLLWKSFKLVAVSDAARVSAPLIALYLLLVLAASVVLHHGVERPAQAWLGRRGATRINPPLRPPALPPAPR